MTPPFGIAVDQQHHAPNCKIDDESDVKNMVRVYNVVKRPAARRQ